ncbi:unnamed protein product [Clonostachys byssicola]|uniref:RRM domain-containing protein n=1 Tax=Clonostachys byssicola TaxID=160290 RepID=A0A9N9Y6I8_9HYPO|nr:unnamed protein product [Clonostachys byssicola]
MDSTPPLLSERVFGLSERQNYGFHRWMMFLRPRRGHGLAFPQFARLGGTDDDGVALTTCVWPVFGSYSLVSPDLTGDLVDNVDFLWLLLCNLSLDMDLLGYWTQDLKDFARQSSLDVVYSETGRDSNGRGFVEFESAADLRTAVEKLDGREFKGSRVQCVADTQPDIPASRGRSRSPGPGRRPYPPPTDDYDRRQPPRGYSPRRDAPYGYRDRSPRRDYYDDRGPRGYRSPPRRPEGGDYPPRGRYDDPYRRDYAPPPDPYTNGRPYERAPRDYPPPRDAPYPREGYPPREYERGGRYW